MGIVGCSVSMEATLPLPWGSGQAKFRSTVARSGLGPIASVQGIDSIFVVFVPRGALSGELCELLGWSGLVVSPNAGVSTGATKAEF